MISGLSIVTLKAVLSRGGAAAAAGTAPAGAAPAAGVAPAGGAGGCGGDGELQAVDVQDEVIVAA